MFIMSQAQDQETLDAGFKTIQEGAILRPELLDNQEIVSPVVAMAKSKGYDADAVKRALPYESVAKEMERIGFTDGGKEKTEAYFQVCLAYGFWPSFFSANAARNYSVSN